MSWNQTKVLRLEQCRERPRAPNNCVHLPVVLWSLTDLGTYDGAGRYAQRGDDLADEVSHNLLGEGTYNVGVIREVSN